MLLVPLSRLSISLRPWAVGCAANLNALSCISPTDQQANSNVKQPTSIQQQRYTSTNTEGPSRLVTDVLHAVKVQKLKDELKDESSVRLQISVEDFVQRAMIVGAAANRDEALRLLSDLHRTGEVLRHVDTVYLQASEIAEIVMMALPGGWEEARLKLSKIEEELRELEDIRNEAEHKAQRITRRFLIAGGCILFTQFVAFIWLTWFELSWDVMEPYAYIISVFNQIVAYTYFLVTNGKVFDLAPFQETWVDRFKESIIRAKGADQTRFQYLTKLKERYRRHLSPALLSEKIA